ncbi:MAG: dephospho-CoA kinase, partial [Pseudomonadota bacterium]|nr:dephospho-CoA kinase [Pseudomonadota bacterium]
NQKDFCSKVLVVDVPVETQVSRTLARDGVSEEQINSIIDSQIDRNERLALADEVISNNGTIEDLEVAVRELHNKFLSEI